MFGLAVSLMFVIIIGVYTWQEYSIDRQHGKADRIENAMISFSAGELLKQVRDTKSFIIFDNIKNIKVTDISMGVARTFKKELDVNDAYVIQGDKIERVRVVQKG